KYQATENRVFKSPTIPGATNSEVTPTIDCLEPCHQRYRPCTRRVYPHQERDGNRRRKPSLDADLHPKPINCGLTIPGEYRLWRWVPPPPPPPREAAPNISPILNKAGSGQNKAQPHPKRELLNMPNPLPPTVL